MHWVSKIELGAHQVDKDGRAFQTEETTGIKKEFGDGLQDAEQ